MMHGEHALLAEGEIIGTMLRPKEDGRKRVIIEALSPEVDAGRFPAKRTVGDLVRVEADIFTDGHDSVSAALLYRHDSSQEWSETSMIFAVNDRWFGEFRVLQLGRYQFKAVAWVDHFETWRRDMHKRIQADSDTALDYLMGAEILSHTISRAKTDDASWLRTRVDVLTSRDAPTERKREVATDVLLNEIVRRYPDRQFASESERTLELVVDPVRGRFCAWYELFPRSTAPTAGQHGTFADCEARLPYIAEMGFDIVYLPPIHPIGIQFRKGRNNSTVAQPGDVGSPWAIGAAEGGHKSIHPDLGTMEDFQRLVKRTADMGMQIALDIAFQAAPDHPYVKNHEEWFRKRPDGTIQYAENPPKKYQDIYPFDFESSKWWEMWQELKSVFMFWIEQGVRIFRVDNPHTKAFAFWEWCITEIKRDYPETLFLSEAFTRPKVMYRLAKLGFSQSYTYFPWRNAKWEITTYLTELTKTNVREFFRPSQWPNTPDILTEFLQSGLRSAFMIRLLLAATLGASYGIYGPAFELMEFQPIQPGKEEYLNSEKYEVRSWDLNRPDSLRFLIALVNQIRRSNEALQTDWGLEFHPVDNEQLICYSKQSGDGTNLVIMVVNLDPHNTQSGFVDLRLDLLNISYDSPYQVHDLLTDATYTWRGAQKLCFTKSP